jgi:hypothetical protein
MYYPLAAHDNTDNVDADIHELNGIVPSFRARTRCHGSVYLLFASINLSKIKKMHFSMPNCDLRSSAIDTLIITTREKHSENHSLTEYACRELDTVFKDSLILQEFLLSNCKL